jgi:uncharacterized protein
MSDIATTFDLYSPPLEKGTPRTFELELYLPPIQLAGQDYRFHPEEVSARLTVTQLDQGYAVTLSFRCRLAGACWRCLEKAELKVEVETTEFFEPELPPVEEMGEEEEATLWYAEDGVINLSEWGRDAVSELLPPKILCREDCLGLCAQCGADLNEGSCDCEPLRDSRWDKLKEWRPPEDG